MGALDLEKDGMIFDIQRYSIHDGPGIRTIVFLKGCPMRCPWCANPESQKACREVAYSKIRCLLCLRCLDMCPEGLIKEANGGVEVERRHCTLCGRCWENCLGGSLQVVGKTVSVRQVLREVLKDRVFYERSGGGVTLSGGEPLAQPEFSAALLAACKNEGLHTAIETSGVQSWDKLQAVIVHTDLVLYDIKLWDSNLHREILQVPNEMILSNAQKIREIGKEMIIRVPIIPGYNDNLDNVSNTVAFAERLGIMEVHLLPYHGLGEVKYLQLGREYKLKGIKAPAREYLENMVVKIPNTRVKVQIGG